MKFDIHEPYDIQDHTYRLELCVNAIKNNICFVEYSYKLKGSKKYTKKLALVNKSLLLELLPFIQAQFIEYHKFTIAKNGIPDFRPRSISVYSYRKIDKHAQLLNHTGAAELIDLFRKALRGTKYQWL